MGNSVQKWNPWIPITEIKQLKILGKCGEEVNELGSAISRCIIQGVDEVHPETGKGNQEWLEDEIADVLATTQLVANHYGLDGDRIEARAKAKIEYLSRWIEDETQHRTVDENQND